MYNYEVSCGRIGVAGGTWGACEERERERWEGQGKSADRGGSAVCLLSLCAQPTHFNGSVRCAEADGSSGSTQLQIPQPLELKLCEWPPLASALGRQSSTRLPSNQVTSAELGVALAPLMTLLRRASRTKPDCS